MMTTETNANAVRKDALAFLGTRPDVTMAMLAQHTKFAPVTVRSFLVPQRGVESSAEVAASVAGVVSRAKAGEILRVDGDEVKARRKRPRAQSYDTGCLRRVGKVLDYCADKAAIGVLTAPYGSGKTWAVQEWLRANPRTAAQAWELTGFRAGSALELIAAIARRFGLRGQSRATAMAASTFDGVVDHLMDNPCLLIFDQGELLRPSTCQMIRQLWDATRDYGVGVAILAAPVFAERMKRARDLEALQSRVGLWVAVQEMSREEMARVVKAEGIADVDEGAFDLWYRGIGGSMRRLMWSIELLKSEHTGRRVTKKTVAGLAECQWGMALPAED